MRNILRKIGADLQRIGKPESSWWENVRPALLGVGVPLGVLILVITCLTSFGLTSFKVNGVAVIGPEAIVQGLKATLAAITICVVAATFAYVESKIRYWLKKKKQGNTEPDQFT